MAAYTKTQIVNDIKNYIRQSGSQYWSEWYVGIAKDAKDRLFTDHNVSEKNGLWIYRQATSEQTARDAEAELLELGCKGGGGGGDENTDFVYAYKITNATTE
ncbi:MAG TPA: hypothetical protein VN578_05410 [Candidatus Binatia bacterium]|nr:hypothetical protein [Candidatus Binatia bacterium]